MIFCTRRKLRLGLQKRIAAWRPLALYWRRKRNLRPVSSVVRAASSVSISYFPQVHLHFTTVVSRSQLRSLVTRIFSSSRTIDKQRDVPDRNWAQIITYNKTLQARAANPLPLGTYAPDATRQKSLLKTATTRTFYVNKSASHQTTHRQNIFTSNIQLQTRHEQLVRSETLLHKRVHSSLLRRSTSSETLVKTAHIHFNRDEELVWRRKLSQTTPVEVAPVANATETVSRQAVRDTSVDTHAQTVAPQNNQSTPQQLTKLDPGLLDRLADDVIRRVEKRARIERDRRGL